MRSLVAYARLPIPKLAYEVTYEVAEHSAPSFQIYEISDGEKT